uniref:Secreted protein n=1 Tax=Heterorhabditis bacteriophora TaxID=37862 RepID=A0A1I7W7F7_HETBA
MNGQMTEGMTTLNFLSTVTTETYPAEGNMGLVINDSLTNLDLNTVEYVPIIAAAVVFSVLLAIGVVAIIVFIAVLIRGRRKFKEV